MKTACHQPAIIRWLSSSLNVLLLCGSLVNPTSAIAGQEAPGAGKSWEASFEDGTVPVDEGTKLTLNVSKDAITAETQQGLAFSIPVKSLLALHYGEQSRYPAAELVGDADHPLAFPLTIALAGLYRKKTDFAVLVWEDEGIRRGVILRLKKGQGSAFAEELQSVSGEQWAKPETKPREIESAGVFVDRKLKGELTKEESKEGEAAETRGVTAEKAPGPAGATVPPAEVVPPRLVRLERPLESRLPPTVSYQLKEVTARQAENGSYHGLDGSTAEVINFPQTYLHISRKYSELPCKKEGGFSRGGTLIANPPVILAEHCNTFYVLDKATLAVKKQLIHTGALRSGPPWWNAPWAVSPNGELVAIGVRHFALGAGPGTKPAHVIVLFDTRNWEVQARIAWRAEMDPYPAIFFNCDGTLLVASDGKRGYEGGPTLQAFHVPSGKLFSEFKLEDGRLRGNVPGHNGLMAVKVMVGYGCRLEVVDLETGKIVQRIDHPWDYQCADLFGLSPNWEYAISHCWGSKERPCHGVVPFKLVDPFTGRVLGTGPIGRAKEDVSCDGISADGKYLRLSIDDKDVVYEVIENK